MPCFLQRGRAFQPGARDGGGAELRGYLANPRHVPFKMMSAGQHDCREDIAGASGVHDRQLRRCVVEWNAMVITGAAALGPRHKEPGHAGREGCLQTRSAAPDAPAAYRAGHRGHPPVPAPQRFRAESVCACRLHRKGFRRCWWPRRGRCAIHPERDTGRPAAAPVARRWSATEPADPSHGPSWSRRKQCHPVVVCLVASGPRSCDR